MSHWNSPHLYSLSWPPDPAETVLLFPTATTDPPPEQPVPVPAGRHRRHRHRFRRPGGARMRRLTGVLLTTLATLLTTLLCVLGGLIAYAPLREAAGPGLTPWLTAWWPVLIYGPWLVASLSVLRAGLNRRHALHSWAVLLLFSGLAVGLGVAQAPTTPVGIAAAGLPPVSALLAFHQIAGQLTPPSTSVTTARHARIPRQRQH